MADLTTVAAMDAFLDADTIAAARQALGIYLTQSSSQTITLSGAFTLGITLTGNTALTFPTSGTLVTTASTLAALAATTSAQLAGVISDETGSGSLVFGTSPTIATPILTGNTTVTTVNKVAITAPATSATLALADGSSLTTSGAFSITLTATAGTTVTLPDSGTLYGTKAGSITSAQLRSSMFDEAGTGALLFAGGAIGAATGTSLALSGALTALTVNGLTITSGGTGTLTIPGTAELEIVGGSITLTSAAPSDVSLPASGTLATVNGNIGNATATSLAATGAITSSSATAGIGYATGAGGTVTQATNKSTTVSLNKVTGQITMFGAALADATTVVFTVNNTTVVAADHITVMHQNTGTIGGYVIQACNVAANSFQIAVRNVSGGSLSEAIVIGFFVHKAVTA